MEFQEHSLLLIVLIREELNRVEINGSQCRRLANRIYGIVEVLKVYKGISKSEDLAKVHDYLLTLLKRVRLLVIECGGLKWVENSLIRANNKEAFEEVHKQLTKFVETYTGFTNTGERSTDFDTATLPPTLNLLDEDAKRDLQEILVKLKTLRGILEERKILEQPAEHVAKIIKVVSDRFEDPAINRSGEQDLSAIYLQIPLEDILPTKLIGTGSYGDVFEAEWLGCKICFKDFPWSGGYSKQWLEEAMPLLKLGHPNVLQLVGFSPSVDDSQECKVLTEIMQGDIRSLIEKKMKEKNGEGTPFNWGMTLDIITQVARGLTCMHQNGFMHGDRVLTTNIIVEDYDDYVDARIGDFGVPQDVPVEHIHVYEPRLDDPKGAVETARWMAPEVCDSGSRETARYSANSDIYSFGMVCYEVLTGKIPFDDYTDLTAVHSSIVAGELRPELPVNLDKRLLDLIKECWDANPSSRPTAPEIVDRLEKIQLSAVPSASASVAR